jgi:hypothetical protein
VEKKSLVAFLRQDMKLFDNLARLPDARTKPAIPLATVLGAVAMMPLFALKSFLALDREARGSELKHLLDSNRRMVVSDSTILRVLGSLASDTVQDVLLATVAAADRLGVLRSPLVEGGRPYRIGIVDGSTMKNHDVVVVDLHGAIDAPVLVLESKGHGYEYATALSGLKTRMPTLGPLVPDIIMGDGLYFNEPIATEIHKLGADFLFKVTTEPQWRQVLSDAHFVIQSHRSYPKYRQTASGYDGERLCSWEMELATATYAGVPVKVAFVCEHYQKDPRRESSTFWILSSALDLSPAELREAGHVRWHIENDVFKRLSHLVGTKRFKCTGNGVFLCFLMLICAATAAIETYTAILRRSEQQWKGFLDGIKPTIGNIMFRLRLQAAASA